MCGLDHLIHEAGPLNFWVLHAATKMEEFSSTLMTPITHIGPVRVAIVLRILFCVQVCGQRRSFLLSVYTPGIRWMNWVSVIFRRLEGCLDRMPSFNHEERSVLVDLDGKGTFLVMLPGFAKERRQDPVLCVLVLQVIVKKVVSHPSRIPHRSVRSPMECDFLDWKVLSMNMYSINRGFDDWFSVSLFPGIPCNKAITYEVRRGGKRKCNQI
ncbi:uncharacterized protein LOC110265166 isoform X1 [Arachis ipaensis]|uniref:uncharacterized protein LOC110265166 isoform X1 n=1 Tax=Arachis ipaensis TaxID=130454 RepID=UPI000A2AF9BD|nr:uncharacterized protein LOC110265166 isoform X1 [Arachis ipaensis]